MKNGKYAKPVTRRGVASKAMVMILSLMLVVGLSVGGTLAWLTATSGSVENTFTVGDINIDLYEHTYAPATNALTGEVTRKGVSNYTIIPGLDLPKDPTVVVEKDSEACWLFVKIEETNWNSVGNKISYAVADGWVPLDGNDDVYYREVGATTADTSFNVLKDNKITVEDSLTKKDLKVFMNEDGTRMKPTLKFTAYAAQKSGIDTAAAAWAELNPTTGA